MLVQGYVVALYGTQVSGGEPPVRLSRLRVRPSQQRVARHRQQLHVVLDRIWNDDQAAAPRSNSARRHRLIENQVTGECASLGVRHDQQDGRHERGLRLIGESIGRDDHRDAGVDLRVHGAISQQHQCHAALTGCRQRVDLVVGDEERRRRRRQCGRARSDRRGRGGQRIARRQRLDKQHLAEGRDCLEHCDELRGGGLTLRSDRVGQLEPESADASLRVVVLQTHGSHLGDCVDRQSEIEKGVVADGDVGQRTCQRRLTGGAGVEVEGRQTSESYDHRFNSDGGGGSSGGGKVGLQGVHRGRDPRGVGGLDRGKRRQRNDCASDGGDGYARGRKGRRHDGINVEVDRRCRSRRSRRGSRW